MSDEPKKSRLIEVAFPLKQASLDSLHEKSAGRAGHISTLHIWPARRPLAASRAALIATLLNDPGDPGERARLLEKLAGRIVSPTRRGRDSEGQRIDVSKQETVGGVLHWGRGEHSPDLDFFREEIRKANGGRAPRMLDPFSGGGAIPLEAMRLGCEATAVDINPVAWFVLKCTLDLPQKLAGQTRPLPGFVSDIPELANQLASGGGRRSTKGKRHDQAALGLQETSPLSAHVRAWAHWVLRAAEKDLGSRYPTRHGTPPIAYLWARTVVCRNCRTSIPLLKTRWLCKTRDNSRRVLLALEVEGKAVKFSVQSDVPLPRSAGAQKREHDRKLGVGTMSDAGVTCPKESCRITMPMEDIRVDARSGALGHQLIAAVVDGPSGKEYRSPTPAETASAAFTVEEVEAAFSAIPFGLPRESTPKGGNGASRAFSVDGYGLDQWGKLFLPRQLVSLATFARHTRRAHAEMASAGYPAEWRLAITSYLALVFDRLANQSSTIARWNKNGQNIEGTFARFALPMVWDFVEVNPLSSSSGSYRNSIDWIVQVVEHLLEAHAKSSPPQILRRSAIEGITTKVDVIVTDPPYYDAIPYSDLMDFFYVWLRRVLHGLDPEYDDVFAAPLAPKWNHATADGELIDDSSRFEGSKDRSKQNYEDGMARAFKACHEALTDDGRLVIVFAHKHPDAWETLAAAIIRAGFVVDASWPIQTERAGRARSLSSAALSSSIWLVCRKRPALARPGWDNRVLEEMRARIYTRLNDFWDAGIRGPDFVWAATGPAMEAYSAHPVVKKANEPGLTMGVNEFLGQVRRIVVDYVVGRVLSKDGAEPITGLDDVTTYYLLHRNDFGFEDAPIGACILYAVSCGLSDNDVTDTYDLLARTGGKGGSASEEEDDDGSDADEGPGEGAGSKVRLRSWDQRKRKSLGLDATGRPAPLVDQVHRLMHLWKAGDVNKVEEYLEARSLKRNQTFHKLLQALIELAEAGSEERAMLESLSNHLAILPAKDNRQRDLF